LLPKRRLKSKPPDELLTATVGWSEAVWEEAAALKPLILSEDELRRGLQLAAHPVFICGVHRSGTTLVRDLLDGHDAMVVLPSEGTYYTNLERKLLALPAEERAAFLGKEWLRRFANPINQPPYWLLGRSTVTDSPYVTFARYFMAWWAVLKTTENTQWPHMAVVLAYACCTGSLSAMLWVDKSPANERFLARIWREMPDAKIIHVIRDPKATFTSRKGMEPGLIIRRVLGDLKTSFQVAVEQQHLKDPRFLLVRYEELCENPEKVINNIADFLQIDVSSALGRPTVAGMPAQANSSFNLEAVAGQILSQNQHKQPFVLGNTELQLLAITMGRLGEKLGYQSPKVGILRRLYLRVIHRLW